MYSKYEMEKAPYVFLCFIFNLCMGQIEYQVYPFLNNAFLIIIPLLFDFFKIAWETHW